MNCSYHGSPCSAAVLRHLRRMCTLTCKYGSASLNSLYAYCIAACVFPTPQPISLRPRFRRPRCTRNVGSLCNVYGSPLSKPPEQRHHTTPNSHNPNRSCLPILRTYMDSPSVGAMFTRQSLLASLCCSQHSQLSRIQPCPINMPCAEDVSTCQQKEKCRRIPALFPIAQS